jgi:hypothetical protein
MMRSALMALATATVVSLVCAGTVAGAVGPAAVAGGVGPGAFAVQVVPAGGSLVAEPYFTPVVSAGGTSTGQLRITNVSSAELSLRVGAVDGLTGQTSGAVYAAQGAPRRWAALWVTPSVDVLSLAPGASSVVDVLVNVPLGASPGDHLAGLSVENAAPPLPSRGGVTQIIRSVTAVLIDVPGPARFRPSIGWVHLRTPRRAPSSQVIVELGDAGNALGQPTLTVTMKAIGGAARRVTQVLDTILPGDHIAYVLQWPRRLARSRYALTVRLGASVRRFASVRNEP